jgi:hypothetical protein
MVALDDLAAWFLGRRLAVLQIVLVELAAYDTYFLMGVFWHAPAVILVGCVKFR